MDPDNGITNFVNLGLYGIKFFILNIIGHDFSHDFTNERLKGKLTHFKAALTNSKAQSSEAIDVTSPDIKKVNNYDTVVKVNQADENIQSIIKTASGKAAASKKTAASTKAAVPTPPPSSTNAVSKKPAASKKSAAPSTEPPPPPPTEAAAPPPPPSSSNAAAPPPPSRAVSSSSNDVAQDQVMEEIVDAENNDMETENIGEILLAFANEVQSKMLEKVATVTRSRFYALQCAANFVSDVKIKVIGKFDQIVRVDGGDSNPTLEYISNSYSHDIKKSTIKTMKSKITRDTNKTRSADRKKHRSNTRKLHSEMRKMNDINKLKSNTRKLHIEMMKQHDKNKHKSNVQKIMSELTKKQMVVNNNKQFDAIIKNALYQEISETSKLPGCEQLNKYYKAMLQLYLCFTPSNDLSPLDIFNLDIIEEALILHVMYEDVDPIVLLKIVIKIKKGNAEKGILFGGAGSHQEIIDMIEGIKGFDKFKGQYSNSIAISPDDLNYEIRNSEINFLKTIVDELIAKIEMKKYEKLSIKRNVINSRYELVTQNIKLITKPTRAPRDTFLNRTKLLIYTNYLKILFEDIYDGCLRGSKQDVAAAAALADTAADTPLAIVADKPCKIVATVARGILKFMIASPPGGFLTTQQSYIFDNRKSDKEEALYDTQLNMILNLANIKIRGGDTLDDHLLTCIKAYALSKSALVNAADPGRNNKIILINSEEEFKRNLSPGHDIINNGARSILSNYGMRDANVTCTLGSIIDPMGSFGNCSSTTIVSEKEGFVRPGSISNGLSLTTDVFISDTDEIPENYYSGRLEQPGTRNSILQYSFKYGDFVLPPVIKTIDTRSSNIIELSVSNTYKSIINKILFMWSNLVLPLQDDGTIDVNRLFDKLIENEGAFIDILSCSTIKNAGDLYQEIGGTIVNRGYDKTQIASESKTYTNQMVEVNNDRPSGSRGAFLLLNGKSSEVNTNAMAGYISEKNCFCVRRTR
jgi:hypothetical protein